MTKFIAKDRVKLSSEGLARFRYRKTGIDWSKRRGIVLTTPSPTNNRTVLVLWQGCTGGQTFAQNLIERCEEI